MTFIGKTRNTQNNRDECVTQGGKATELIQRKKKKGHNRANAEMKTKTMDKISKTRDRSFENSKHKPLIKVAKQKGMCSAKCA